MEAIDWRCLNCGGFHGYENCPYYGQLWENRPDNCWEGKEDLNPWNPPYHQYYGEHEHQPLEQEEPHQGHGGGKKSLEELLEGFITRIDNNYKNQEDIIKNQGAAIKSLEIRLQEISRQLMEESHSSSQNDMVMSIEEQWEELEVEEKKRCELIEETLVPQALKMDEEEELPKEASEDDLELECENMVGEQEDQVVGCEELKEVPIVDFVFGDILRIDEEKPQNISMYLMKSWSNGVQGKEQVRGGDVVNTLCHRISENALNPLILNLSNVAMIHEYSFNTMMELGQNLHDLK